MVYIKPLSLTNGVLVIICILTLVLGDLVISGRTSKNKALGYRVESTRNVIQETKAGTKWTLIDIHVVNKTVHIEKGLALPYGDEVVGIHPHPKWGNRCSGRERSFTIEMLRFPSFIYRFSRNIFQGGELLRSEPHLGYPSWRFALVGYSGFNPKDLKHVWYGSNVREISYGDQEPRPVGVHLSICTNLGGRCLNNGINSDDECSGDQQDAAPPKDPVSPTSLTRNSGWSADSYRALCVGCGLAFVIVVGVCGALRIDDGRRRSGWVLIGLAFAVHILSCVIIFIESLR